MMELDTSSTHNVSKEYEPQYMLEEFKSWATKSATDFANECDTVCSEEFPKVKTCDEVLPDMKATKFFEGTMAEACSTEHNPKAAFSRPVESLKGWSVELNKAFTFSKKDGLTPKSVMLLGPAGSGKTTAMKRFLRDNSDFNIMLCRQNSHEEKVSVRDFVFPDKSGIDKNILKKGYKWMKENPNKVNFFLDALDTVPYATSLSSGNLINTHDEELHSPADILSSIMAGNLFAGCKVFFTSREYGVVDLPEELRPNRVITLVGLSKESTKKVVHSRLQDKAEEFCSVVDKKYPGLWSVMSSPLFLVFALISHTVKKIGESFVPSTISGILVVILNMLPQSPHGDSIVEEDVFGRLKELSYKGIVKGNGGRGKVTFELKDLEDVGLTKKDTSSISIHTPDQTKGIEVLQEKNQKFIFCHQSLQEVLAALFVVEMKFEEFRNFVSKELTNPRLSLVRQFIAGILLNQEVLQEAGLLPAGGRLQSEIMDIKKKQKFFSEAIKKELQIPKKKIELLELFRTLCEAGDGLKNIIHSGIPLINLSGRENLTVSDLHAIGSVVKYCNVLDTLNLSDCGLNHEKMEGFLCGLGNCGAIKVTEFDLTDNWDLGEVGLKALVKMLKIISTEKVALDACKLEAGDLKSFALALREGDIKLKELRIQEYHGCIATPEMTAAVIDLLPQISETLNLDRWEFSEEDKSKIEEKLKSAYNMDSNYKCCVNFGRTAVRSTICAMRWEDCFDELMKEFPLDQFKRFARSSEGLCLSEPVVQGVEDDCKFKGLGAYDFKLALLKKWKQLTDCPSVSNLKVIVQNYRDFEVEDMSQESY